MEIVETSIYTEDITKILNDEEYKELQLFLVKNPKSGDLIKGSKGLSKLRWKLKNRGKSGGIRNIYYYYENKNIIYMIYVYEKSKTEDLTPKQIEILRKTFLGD
jgi:mRNA-degrading endonuclease RelE of RelBE toxin-antitoxin system